MKKKTKKIKVKKKVRNKLFVCIGFQGLEDDKTSAIMIAPNKIEAEKLLFKQFERNNHLELDNAYWNGTGSKITHLIKEISLIKPSAKLLTL